MWAIYNDKLNFYTGTWLTKKEAIAQHIKEKGGTWRSCRVRGDRCIEVVVVPIERENGCFVSGNNGGDNLTIKHLKDNMVYINVDHCCVHCFSGYVPIEVLTFLLSSVDFVEAIKNSEWPDDFKEELIKQVHTSKEGHI